jgi:hypothetical protein
MVIKPVRIHRNKIQPEAPKPLDISAVTMKIPDPIMEPATKLVASRSPSDFFGLSAIERDFLVVLLFRSI